MSTASTAVARGTAGRWLRPALRFTGMVYLQTLLWLGVWVLVPVSVFGYQAVALDSDSMAPAVRAGDVLLLQDYDGGSLDAGRIVTFGDIARDGRLVTHRVVGQNDDGTFQTKGDANRSADSTPVEPARISGVGRLVVPLVGLPVVWASTGQWTAFVAWAGLSVMVFAFLLPATSGPRRRNRRVRRRQSRLRQLTPPASPPLIAPAPQLPEPPTARFAVVPPPPRVPRGLRLPEPPARPVLPAPPARSGLPPPLRSTKAPRPLPVAPLPRAPQRGLAPSRPRTRRWAVPLHLLLVVGVLAAGPLATSAAAALRGTTHNTGNTATAHQLASTAAPTLNETCTVLLGLLTQRITVSWTLTGDPSITGFQVERSTNGTSFSSVAGVQSASTTSYVDNSVNSNTKYWYRIRSLMSGTTWSAVSPASDHTTKGALCL